MCLAPLLGIRPACWVSVIFLITKECSQHFPHFTVAQGATQLKVGNTLSHTPLSVLISVEAMVKDDMNSYISQYYNGPSSGKCGLGLFACTVQPQDTCDFSLKPKDRYNLAWLQVARPTLHTCRL